MQSQLKRDAGISLIEMVVAVLVLSIGVTAGFQSFSAARQGIGREMPRLVSQQVALNRAENLQLLGAGVGASLSDRVEMGGIAWTVKVETEPTEGGFVEFRIRASAQGQPGTLLTGYAPVGPPQ